MPSLFLSLLLLLLLLPVQAEETAPVKMRLELEAHRTDHVDVLPLGAEGFVVLTQSGDYKDGTIRRYNAVFVEQARWDLPGGAAWRPCPHDVRDASVRLCFFTPSKSTLHVVTLPSDTDNLDIRDLSLPQKWVNAVSWSPEGLWVVTGKADTQERPSIKGALARVDLAAGTVREVEATVPGSGKSFLQGFSTIADGTVWVEAGRVKGGRRALSLLRLDPTGAPVGIPLPDPQGHTLLTARVVEQANGARTVTGAFALRENDATANGLWLAPLGADEARFVPFGDFQHYFDYLSDRQEARLEKKIAKKKAKGKTLDVRSILDVRDIVDQGDRLLVIGEVRVPVYSTHTYTTTSTVNGVTTTTTHTVTTFQGWKTTHVLIAALDPDGQLLWDQSLPLDPELIPVPRRHVHVDAQEGELRIRYVSNRQIVTQTVRGDDVEGPPQELKRATDSDDEEVRRTFSSGAAPWTEGDWLLWGVEKVKSEDEGKRVVFAVSRVGGEE